MKHFIKPIICILISLNVLIIPMHVLADSVKVVTIGADLSTEQKDLIFQYFGVNEKQVEVINVTNEDERRYLDGIATSQQIGRKTYSCSYIEPTESGGIHIKTANLSWVTCEMIRNALITSGITNCNVVAASPIEVSGTGSLTGIFMAYETVNKEELDEEKTELASEELITTMDIANNTGQEEAANMLSDLKEDILLNSINDRESITEIVNQYIKDMNIDISEEQKWQLIELLLKISKQNYDIAEIKQTYENMKETVKDIQEKTEVTMNFFEKLWNWIKNIFTKADDTLKDLDEKAEKVKQNIGIIANTDDSLLTQGTVVTSTEDKSAEQSEQIEQQKVEKEGFWKTLWNNIKSFFSPKDTDTNEPREVDWEDEQQSVSNNDVSDEVETGVLDEVVYETEEDTKPLSKPTLNELVNE